MRHHCNTSIEVSYELLKNTDIDSSLDTDIAKALEQDRDDRLHEAVEALSEKISEIVKLHYLEGFSVGEISEKLNILAGNVKRRLRQHSCVVLDNLIKKLTVRLHDNLCAVLP